MERGLSQQLCSLVELVDHLAHVVHGLERCLVHLLRYGEGDSEDKYEIPTGTQQ